MSSVCRLRSRRQVHRCIAGVALAGRGTTDADRPDRSCTKFRDRARSAGRDASFRTLPTLGKPSFHETHDFVPATSQSRCSFKAIRLRNRSNRGRLLSMLATSSRPS